MQSPTVSVLIPTYNYAEYIGVAIESVLHQTLGDFELIIVYDHSTDHNFELVLPFLSDKRVRYYENPVNLGLSQNWNRCLSLARGEYIKFLMADDLFHSTLLETFVPVFERYPKVSLVTSYKYLINEEGAVIENYQQPFSLLQDGKKVIYESLKSHNFIGEPTTVMFRKENLHLDSFNTNFSWIPDWDMWLRQLTLGDCYIVPEALSYFRIHDKQATVQVSKTLKRQAEEYAFYKYLKTVNPYNIDFGHLDINGILKLKSYKYIRSSIKGLLQRKKSSWSVFNDAAKKFVAERIAYPF